jgi:hypothetical protein
MGATQALNQIRKATEKKDEPTVDISTLPPPGPNSPLAFYHATQKMFVFSAPHNGGGHVWVDLPRERYKVHLLAQGFGPRMVESILCWCEVNERIQYFGPVAGRAPGFYEDNGNRIVIDRGPTLLEPVPGEWCTLRKVLEGLLYFGETPETGEIQMDSFHGWVRSSVAALRAGRRQSQQVLVICGPEDCGKSLVQHLLTHFLGGRSAKAHRYFSGATSFNGDMLGAEHLIIEDDYMPSDMKSRLSLGAQFKQFAVGTESVSFNAKFQQAINLRAFFRVSVTCNDEPENLMVLPPLNGDIGGKILIVRASRFTMPMPTVSAEEKEVFWNTLHSEIPAYLHWLLNEFQLPDSRLDRRYGVSSWIHPAILSKVAETTPEEAFLSLIDKHFFYNIPDNTEPVERKAEDIRMDLLSSGDDYIRRQAERLLPLAHCAATYLARLSKINSRVVAPNTEKSRNWTIHLPEIHE